MLRGLENKKNEERQTEMGLCSLKWKYLRIWNCLELPSSLMLEFKENRVKGKEAADPTVGQKLSISC